MERLDSNILWHISSFLTTFDLIRCVIPLSKRFQCTARDDCLWLKENFWVWKIVKPEAHLYGQFRFFRNKEVEFINKITQISKCGSGVGELFTTFQVNNKTTNSIILQTAENILLSKEHYGGCHHKGTGRAQDFLVHITTSRFLCEATLNRRWINLVGHAYIHLKSKCHGDMWETCFDVVGGAEEVFAGMKTIADIQLGGCDDDFMESTIRDVIQSVWCQLGLLSTEEPDVTSSSCEFLRQKIKKLHNVEVRKQI